jgi:hypothetical protein
MTDRLREALKAKKLPALKAALKANPKTGLQPKIIVEASGMAWLEALELLSDIGADQ